MSWPPLSLNQVDLLTFRTCSLSSSQTNALWSSRRSWSWRVSQGLDPVFFFLCEVAVYCCVDSPRSSLVSSPPASFRLLFPLLQRPDSQPLLLSETQWVTPPNLQHRHLFFIIYFFFPAQFFFSFFFLLLHQFVPNGQKSESSTQTGVQSSCSSSAVLLSERLSSSSMWRHARSLTSQSNLCFISICFFLSTDRWRRSKVTPEQSSCLQNTLRYKHDQQWQSWHTLKVGSLIMSVCVNCTDRGTGDAVAEQRHSHRSRNSRQDQCTDRERSEIIP